MKLRYFVLVTVLTAIASAACADSPTASKPDRRSPVREMMTEGDTVTKGGGSFGTGH
jgi:hypothetical protein